MITQRLDQFVNLIQETEGTVNGHVCAMGQVIRSVHELLGQSKTKGNRVFVIGNGGSAGIASHHVVDLVNVVKAAAVCVGEPGLLSCMGNDYGYEHTFSRPLEALTQPGDLLVAISSSGKSKNILNACDVVKKKGGSVVTLSGFQADNPLRKLGDVAIWAGKEDYGLVETAHFFILHTIIDTWKSFDHE